MPLALSRADRRLFLGVATVFLAMVAGSLVLAGNAGSKAEIPSSYSTGSDGAKAAYLLLQETGNKSVRWERTLSELPDPSGKTLILAEPEQAATREDRKQLDKFIKDGGHIIATGWFAGVYLPNGFVAPDLVEGMVWKQVPALSPSEITRQAPSITMAPQAYWSGSKQYLPLYGDADHVRVVKYRYGKGEVIWWAAATPLTNAGLREPGNLEFFLACVGSEPREILWDEYIHGHRQTLGGSLAHSPLVWLFLQAGVFALAVILTFSRRSGPVFQPVTDVRLSPLEFVHTLGGLYERAGAGSVAVDIAYQRFRYWLARRLGLSVSAKAEELEQAVTQRSLLNSDRFATTLRECEVARYDPGLRPEKALQLVQELYEYAGQLKLFPVSGKN